MTEANSLEAPVRRRTGGRSARNRDAVLRATLELLAEQGTSGLNFSEIGKRSGVHATSVQRRWGTRENVLIDALLAYSERNVPLEDKGSLRDDLVAFARSLQTYFNSPLGGSIVRMMAAAEGTPELSSNRAMFFTARFEMARAMIDRAKERGELRPEIDPRLVMELVSAPLYFRTLMTREPIDDDFVIDVIDTLLLGFYQK